MLLACLACLLSDCSLHCPSVSESAGFQSLGISRQRIDGDIGDVICKLLELGVLGNEVCLAPEAYDDSLVTVYTGNDSALGSLAVSPLGCNELSFLADDLLGSCIVAFSLALA